ncbi:hypothetical protein EDB89DRAFT_2016767 [Lactarius sanguifluus]|nr:hypothetical protein EDB89DRAFT_2016767 [Lactarius sanguifluus]
MPLVSRVMFPLRMKLRRCLHSNVPIAMRSIDVEKDCCSGTSNLRRPIHYAAHDWPLALCDCNSIDRSCDLVVQTLKYPDRDGETHAVMWNESHRWKHVCGIRYSNAGGCGKWCVNHLPCLPWRLVLISPAALASFDSIQNEDIIMLTFKDPTTPPNSINSCTRSTVHLER